MSVQNQIVHYDAVLLDVFVFLKKYVLHRICKIELHKMTRAVTLENIYKQPPETVKIMHDSQRASYTERNIIKHIVEKQKNFEDLSIRELSKKPLTDPVYILSLRQKL